MYVQQYHKQQEKILFFSDPALLERMIRKENRSASIDNNIRLSIDTPNSLTDSCALPTIDTSVQTSIDICP